MRLQKVRFKNGYKRFHDLTIDLGPTPARIVVLVGPNGCGKSSVLDGLLYHAQNHHYIGTNSNRDHTYHSMNGGQFNRNNIEIDFTTGPFHIEAQKRQPTGDVGTIFSFRSPYRYNSQLKISETRATSEIRLNNYGAGDAASLDAKMEENYRRLYAVYNKYLESANVRPSEAKAKIIGDLNLSIRNCLDIEVANLGNVEASKGTLYFKKADHPHEFEFNVLSSGEKEVVDLLLDLYLRKEDYSDTVFLIDEPELHINTSIQGKLLREIDRLVGDNCQIWITTHSIGFLREIQKQRGNQCQIIQFRPEYQLASSVIILRPVKATPAIWRNLFAVALDDLADLISPKIIVYCEGRSDPGPAYSERGLDAKVYNAIFSDNHPDVLFVSSGGNTELDQRSSIALAVLGKVFPTLDIWVLKDRDMASGKHTTEADRQTYLKTNPTSHRVIRRWELENYLFDKETLKAYCHGEGLEFDEIAYDKLVSNIADQDLKNSVSHIKNFCGIKSSINAETFKILLADFVDENSLVYKELHDCIFERR